MIERGDFLLLRNVFESNRKVVNGCHNGVGSLAFSRVFSCEDFISNIDFVDYAVIPPGSSIGYHQHKNNEELYLVLQGSGIMCVGNNKFVVKPGDLIVNPFYSAHSLENSGSLDIHIFVIQVSNPQQRSNTQACISLSQTKQQIQTVIGIDIGGTFTKIATYTVQGEILNFSQYATPRFELETELIDFITELVETQKVSGYKLCGVGVGLCGLVDESEGKLKSSCLFPLIKNLPVANLLTERIKLPVLIANDSNLAALGEYTFGNARQSKMLVTLTLGTGVGAGILIDGKPFHGAGGYAGEVGHMLIDPNGPTCFCGSKGCLNVLTSSTALVNFYHKDLPENNSTLLTAQQIGELLKDGDEKACRAFNQICNYLGIALANIISLLNPDLIVLSGGLSCIGTQLLEDASIVAKRHLLNELWEETRVELSELKEKVGAAGAAALVIRYLEGVGNE